MKRRSESQWQQLITDQAASDLSAVEFCREHSLNPKYFSTKKSRLKQSASSFIKANIADTPPTNITLQYGSVTMTLPSSTSSQWLAQLLFDLTV
jgi:hypothetical protein